jgi:hypothetical protein
MRHVGPGERGLHGGPTFGASRATHRRVQVHQNDFLSPRHITLRCNDFLQDSLDPLRLVEAAIH